MIQLYHVSKRFKNGKDALVDVSLRVREGEFVFLTGASGAGKSTLLRLLLVMERVSDGQVLIGGRNVHVLRDASVPYLRRNIGLVFQDFKLIERRTVFDNVAIAMEILGLAPAEIQRRVMQLLADLGLEDRARAMPAMLSGGERQRVALARALANEPAILLADEPTGNLDPSLSIEIMDLLLDINRRGTTVVVATHDYALVKRYGLRVVHLENGRIAEDRPRTHPAADMGDEPPPAPVVARKTGPKVSLPTPAAMGVAEVQADPPKQSAFDIAAGDQAILAANEAFFGDDGGAEGDPIARPISRDVKPDDDAIAPPHADAPMADPWPDPPSSLDGQVSRPSPAAPDPRILPANSRLKKLTGSFSAANVRIEAVRITGPVMPKDIVVPTDTDTGSSEP